MWKIINLLISEIWKSDAVLDKSRVIFWSRYERPGKVQTFILILHSWTYSLYRERSVVAVFSDWLHNEPEARSG